MSNEIKDQEVVEQETPETEIDLGAGESEIDALDEQGLENETTQGADEETDNNDEQQETEAEQDVDGEQEIDSGEEQRNKHGEVVTHDPLKDTQARLTKASQENAEWRNWAKQQIDNERAALGDFEELDAEEFKMLQDEDPRAALDYLTDLKRHQSLQDREQQLQQVEQEEARNVVYQKTVSNVIQLAEQSGFQVMENGQLNRQKFEEFANDARLLKVSDFLNDPANGFARQQDGTFTTQQMKIAWDIVTRDDATAQERAEAYQAAARNIQNAQQNSTSRLNRAPGARGTAPKAAPKTQEEIEMMGEAELDAYLAQNE